MHELYDCIDDYGNGKIRVVTKNEYILYGCLIPCFIEALEQEKQMINVIKIKEEET